jgi:hypothetical protein
VQLDAYRTLRYLIFLLGCLALGAERALAQGVIIPSSIAPPQEASNQPSGPQSVNPNPELNGGAPASVPAAKPSGDSSSGSNSQSPQNEGKPAPFAEVGKALFEAVLPEPMAKIADKADQANDLKEIAAKAEKHGPDAAETLALQKAVDGGLEKGLAWAAELEGVPEPVAKREAKVATAIGRSIRETSVGEAILDAEVSGGRALLKTSDAAEKAFSGSEFDLSNKVNPAWKQEEAANRQAANREAAHALQIVGVRPSVTENGAVRDLTTALQADADHQAALKRAADEAARQVEVARLAAERRAEQQRIVDAQLAARARLAQAATDQQEREAEARQQAANAAQEQEDEADKEAEHERHREAREAFRARHAGGEQPFGPALVQVPPLSWPAPSTAPGFLAATPAASSASNCDISAAVRAARPSPGDSSALGSLQQNLDKYCPTHPPTNTYVGGYVAPTNSSGVSGFAPLPSSTSSSSSAGGTSK